MSCLLPTWLCCGHVWATTPGASWACIPTAMSRAQDHWGPREARDWGQPFRDRAGWQCGGRGAAGGVGGEETPASYSPLCDPTEHPAASVPLGTLREGSRKFPVGGRHFSRASQDDPGALLALSWPSKHIPPQLAGDRGADRSHSKAGAMGLVPQPAGSA